LLHRGNDFFNADVGSGEDAPADFFGHGYRLQVTDRQAVRGLVAILG
jgi:hypothetical protein